MYYVGHISIISRKKNTLVYLRVGTKIYAICLTKTSTEQVGGQFFFPLHLHDSNISVLRKIFGGIYFFLLFQMKYCNTKFFGPTAFK